MNRLIEELQFEARQGKPARSRTSTARVRTDEITAVCILGLIGLIFSIGLMFWLTPSLVGRLEQQFGSWLLPVAMLSIAVSAVSLMGMWMMKKWAGYTFVGMHVVSGGIALALGMFSPPSLITSGYVSYLVMTQVPKMN